MMLPAASGRSSRSSTASIVSGLERLVKPDPRIYRVFCERYGLAPESCVFIDDSEPNVISARKIGMHGDPLRRALRKLPGRS